MGAKSLDQTQRDTLKKNLFVVAVVQLVERQIVILVVVGSSPIGHPTLKILKACVSGPFLFLHSLLCYEFSRLFSKRDTMPHIKFDEKLSGIRGPMAFRPATAQPLNLLVDALLHTSEGITAGERELIATYVSALNDCFYCQTTHGAVAAAHLDGNEALVQQVKSDYLKTDLSPKMKALLAIAERVQKGGKLVTAEVVAQARDAGATDLEIHDTVLIAAAFCMFNRYVDGLDTWSHQDMDMFRTRGQQVAKSGYTNANLELMKPKT